MKLRSEEERNRQDATKYSEKRARKPKPRASPSLRTREEFVRNRMEGLSFDERSPAL